MSQIRLCRSLALSRTAQINKRPLLRGWFWSERARNQPANGEYDFNTGRGDYFFGKPYFVHQKASDIYYEQIGWLYSGHDMINIVLLRDVVYVSDEIGTEAAGKRGETVSVPKDVGREMIGCCDAMYATPENVQ